MMSYNPKRGSYIEEEIEIKPSTELIPDEYEHFEEAKQKIIFHTFTIDNIEKESENEFLKTVEKYGYKLTDENINKHSLDKENLDEVLDKIISECEDAAELILLFTGFVQNNGYLDTNIIQNNVNIQEIWLKFSSYRCPQLKNKPKIFIFDLQIETTQIQTDGKRYYGSGYDTPAEADILVICNRTEGDDDNDFMNQFCDNIKMYAETENIITLATCIGQLSPPLIISTLTRNFFFTASNLRGHHRAIEQHHQEMKNHIQDIKEALDKKYTEKKKKSSIFDSFRIGKKTKSDVEPANKSPLSTKKTNNENSPVNTSNSNIASGSRPSAIVTQTRRTSGPNAPRTRQMSQSEPDGTRSSTRRLSEKKKNIWRP